MKELTSMAAESLAEVLKPAFAPCRNFRDVCQEMRWAPEAGYVPRGFGGAKGELDQVRLILVVAEPGNPAMGEKYGGSPTEMMNTCFSLFEELFLEKNRDRRGSPFFNNLRTILNLCWPDRSPMDQLRATWFTNAVKCSAKTSGGKIPAAIEQACISSYLARELKLFPNAYVLALGDKARNRLREAQIRVDGWAQHPSARVVTNPTVSWKAAAENFRAWLHE